MSGDTIVKIILLLLASCGLIYQVQIIYRQFMSGKTIVSIEIGRLYNQTLPAITLCLPDLYSMERAAQYDPGMFGMINETYTALVENNNRSSWNLYHDTFINYTDEKMNTSGLNIRELFDKLSLKFKALDNNTILKF